MRHRPINHQHRRYHTQPFVFSLSKMEFTIFVEALDGDGEFMTLRVQATTTVRNVKEMIEDISTAPTSWLHVSFRGVRLNNWKTLAEYNIQDGALLALNACISEEDL